MIGYGGGNGNQAFFFIKTLFELKLRVFSINSRDASSFKNRIETGLVYYTRK